MIDNIIKFINSKFIDKYINFVQFSYPNDIIMTNYTKIEQKIIIYSNKINKSTELIHLALTDLYFIRRFLDKNYINNGILYTGHSHMCNIMVILIKFFNFKLTNIFYKQDFDIDKYIKKISFKNFEYIYTIILFINF